MTIKTVEWYENAFAKLENAKELDYSAMADICNELAGMYSSMNAPDKVMEWYLKGLDIKKKVPALHKL